MNTIIKHLSLLVMTVLLLWFLFFPLYIMIKITVSNPADIFTQHPSYFITHSTLEHFYNVFRSGSIFFMPLLRSLMTALGASFIALIIAIPAAYAIARFNYRVRYVLMLIIFITRMMPEISIALPISIIFIRIGLFDTMAGLIIAHVIRMLPITCFILVSVFAGLPRELEEQACVDGCSRAGALIKIILPLSWGGISVAGIFSFLLSWDEFIYASYLSLAHPTMPLKMYYYIARGDIFYSATYAVIITVPVLLLTLILQKYLKADYLAGAMKG